MSEHGEKKERGVKNHPFVSYLEHLRDDEVRSTKALAQLRRGLGKRMGTPDMYLYVVPFLPEHQQEQERYFLIASLFALHPERAPRGISIGMTFWNVYLESDHSESIERRFKALLASDIEDLGHKLRSAVSLAKSKGVGIDYHRLFYDIKNWDHPDGFVQMSWARDFWGFQGEKENKNDKGE